MDGLLRARLPNWAHDEAFLAETTLDYTWADPDLPSLVAVDDRDEIIGFIGAQVRRFILDDRPLRGVCCSHLTVAGDRRAGAAGALLLRRLLSGPQDLTFTDSATDTVARIWRALGGHSDHPRSCDWMLALRPVRWAGAILKAAAGRRSVGRGVVPVGALPLQVVGPRVMKHAFPEPPPDVSGEATKAGEIVAHLPALTRGARLRPDYDESHLTQLFKQVEGETRNVLVRRLVRRGDVPIGWYAYERTSVGVSRVLHLAAAENSRDAVLAELIEHSRSGGSAITTGRLEPHLDDSLRRRLAVLGLARQPMIHARDPQIQALLATSASLLTLLDSEWYVT